MATLAVTSAAAGKVLFGIPANENSLLTKKVSISRKVEKKDLRGRRGDYKAILSYNQTYEVSIESVMPSNLTSPYELGLSHTLDALNGALNSIPSNVQMVIEEVTTDFKNDDFASVSVKMFGYAAITSAAVELD